MSKTVFLLLPRLQILDLAGPAQVYDQANDSGANYEIEFVGVSDRIVTAQGPVFSELRYFEEVELNKGDTLFIPGTRPELLNQNYYDQLPKSLWEWLWSLYNEDVRICSVCTGSFFLAEAGLLNGKSCTTHWTCQEIFQKSYREINVMPDVLYTKEFPVYTSAGVASGIDLSLALVEEDYGPYIASDVAAKLIVYYRRNPEDHQVSTYFNYRNHPYGGIHKVQNLITRFPKRKFNLDRLAEEANMSSRNLTRKFKEATGVTITEFSQIVKLELAKNLINFSNNTVDESARLSGLSN
ncbi:GlxA family transcriptional regulator [Flagellimonas algicola]|uniref:Helix-turn-helix domain-containing protein n=1 Tax=Flagellimonas algicola TaxID=2583815 RepID=A0ABY2WND8_9FLAO|nr:DJ-1/PfpI family protein [Allomuricauda algicola]TMU56034.1 helix-turn-helix domain-containing protein [Allomuricauda algicola]